MEKEEILDDLVFETKHELPERNPSVLFHIGITMIVLGTLFWSLTGIVDGLICQNFFKEYNTFLAERTFSITATKGLSDGISYGSIMGIFFSISFGIITKVRGSYELAWKYIKVIFRIFFLLWLAFSFFFLIYSLLKDFVITSDTNQLAFLSLQIIPHPWNIGAFLGKFFGFLISLVYFPFKIYFHWKEKYL